MIDIRNNVFYNWGGKFSGYNADTDSVSRYDFVGNYYLQGPNSRTAVAFDESDPLASMYFAGNWMNGKPVEDALAVVNLPGGVSLATGEHVRSAPATEPADAAFRAVLARAGASLARDSVDRRVVAEVRSGTGRIIDDAAEVGGWPEHESAPPPPDSDGDGMPDDWESRNGLDPTDPADGPLLADGGYTNLEIYLDSLVRLDASRDATREVPGT